MVELKKVSVGYGGSEVIKPLDITFEKGKITSIIGKNGCGKTTLLKVASRQIMSYTGDVLIDGRDINCYENKEFAKRVSYLPQTRNVPQISVGMLVMHGRFPYLTFPRKPSKKDKRIVEDVMESAGVIEFRNKYISELSGGERQKVYIAMAIAQDTDIVFLDEPTTYLDINQQLEIIKLIRMLKQVGKTIIMVIHDISAALCYSDKVCLIDSGELVIHDEPKKVYESKEIQRIFNINCQYLTSNCIRGYLFSLK